MSTRTTTRPLPHASVASGRLPPVWVIVLIGIGVMITLGILLASLPGPTPYRQPAWPNTVPTRSDWRTVRPGFNDPD